jgi:hypothetical protein
MAFYRIYPIKDAWITDASPDSSLSTRATGSNHGSSPVLNVFARKGDINSSSIELARSLVQFDVTELSGKIYTDKVIPSSSVTYVLKMFDMKHDDTVPTSYDMFVYPLSRSWDEGSGVDDDNFRDSGYVNWMSASSTTAWTVSGSDFITASFGSASQHFDRGQEDLEATITDIVTNWLTGSLPKNGLIVKLGTTEETNGTDYYVKKFHSRESKYVDRIPYIEARWNDVIKDNRKNFGFNVENKLVMYNFVRGELTFATEPVTLRIQDHLVGNSASYSQTFTTYQIASGVLTASVNISNTASFSASFYDIWFSGSKVYLTGTFRPLVLSGSDVDPYNEFVVDVVNLKRVYDSSEEARIKVNVRNRDYKTHRGVVASASLDIEREYIEKMYYSIINDETGEVVVPFGTGSVAYTQLSYDGDGNYFIMWMNSLVPGFKYRLKFLIDINRYDKKVVDDDFVFKVV